MKPTVGFRAGQARGSIQPRNHTKLDEELALQSGLQTERANAIKINVKGPVNKVGFVQSTNELGMDYEDHSKHMNLNPSKLTQSIKVPRTSRKLTFNDDDSYNFEASRSSVQGQPRTLPASPRIVPIKKRGSVDNKLDTKLRIGNQSAISLGYKPIQQAQVSYDTKFARAEN